MNCQSPITTETDAIDAIAAVCKYLEKRSHADIPIPSPLISDTETERLARTMCHEILEAVGADGNGGCQLCRS